MIRLETPRLILRDHEPDDLEPYIAIESDPEYRARQVAHPRAELERSFREAAMVPKPLGFWATEVRVTGQYIGRCGLYPRRTDAGIIVPDELNLGYYIARPAWGNGYATEAARALVAWAFATLGTRKVHAGLPRENPRSRRVVEKVGFTFIGPDPNPGSPALEFELDRPVPDGNG